MSSTLLRMQHTSLQVQDSPEKKFKDIRDLFVEGVSFPIKTGTEGGEFPAKDHLRMFAGLHNHVIHFARGNWIAVDRKILKKGSVQKGSLFIQDNDDFGAGGGHDRVLCTLEFDHINPGVGHIVLGAIHYGTKGRTPKDPNWESNKLAAKRIARWMRKEGAGRDLVFLNGDFNMNDADPKQDWAFGGPFTSMADELNRHENTGHGPIDGFCSYDLDRRVKAKHFNVLNDKEMFQYSDHYVCRGVWEVLHLSS